MKFERFIGAMSADEKIFITGLFDNYLKDTDTPLTEGDAARLMSITAKAGKTLPDMPLRKLIFAVADIMRDKRAGERKSLPVRRENMDLVAHSKAATAIRDFLMTIEGMIRRDKFPFLTSARFGAILRKFSLTELLRDGCEHRVLKELLSPER
jgi:hypothetical protein